MEQLLHHLRNLGFTEIESKIMVDLAQHGPAGGYEVAKRLGASRSNVYAAMQRLEKHGALEKMEGEPVRYRSLKPEELTRMISGRVEASLAFVEKSLPRSSGTAAPFLSMEGDQAVMDVLVRELKRAQHEIVVDVWREEAALLREPLAEAESRGVKVLWACGRTRAGTIQNAGVARLAGLGEAPTRRSQVLFRDRSAMVPARYARRSYDTGAVITEHPVMAELLLHHFSQEMVLFQLEQDMGEQLEERYGRHFGWIQSQYLHSDDELEHAEEQYPERVVEEVVGASDEVEPAEGDRNSA